MNILKEYKDYFRAEEKYGSPGTTALAEKYTLANKPFLYLGLNWDKVRHTCKLSCVIP